jgi:hypothetical protein
MVESLTPVVSKKPGVSKRFTGMPRKLPEWQSIVDVYDLMWPTTASVPSTKFINELLPEPVSPRIR